MCPLKEAALDAPNQIAILSEEGTITFSQLDQYCDRLTPPSHPLRVASTIHDIALFFAAWRHNQSIFPINPRLPQEVNRIEAPPQSLLLFTSGSTSLPKIAILSLSNLLANASGALPYLDLKPNDLWRLTLPLYHVGGIGILIRSFLARATVALCDHPEVTHLSYIPTHLYRATPVYRKLKRLLLGGAPIASFPQHLPIYVTYGLTEMASMVTLNGSVLPQREVQLSAEGEILVRGPCLFQGYVGQPPVASDWFPTGDLGRFVNGELQIIGRKDWMFICGGENIQPEEIERELLSLPSVVEAAVIGKDDPEFGKRPVAIVKAQNKLTLQQMQVALRDRLPKYKIPIELYLVDEIPKKNGFKINRLILSQFIQNEIDEKRPGQKK